MTTVSGHPQRANLRLVIAASRLRAGESVAHVAEVMRMPVQLVRLIAEEQRSADHRSG
ncbi:MAG: hypothetical protein ACTHJ6_08990 [Oryzihumus sp.]